ncbi:MAG: EutN/CcmL family microcompartment protein [candidate division KSB1 bacterium]|nr:EutN/CcmL family microcompartment protein [candidate division KSB1 bacterium]MDZ7346943.1 EutN/CcmL family microcompartment protein [candidate division KSB1 bacterium]
MEIGRVVGTVVSTAKVDRLIGQKLMLVNVVNPDLKPTSNYVVAVDGVGAGANEIVIVVRGSSARQAQMLQNVPTDASIVAIVDAIELGGQIVYQKSGGQ